MQTNTIENGTMRMRIAKAGADLFRMKGFEETTVEDVLKEFAIEKSTFYCNFHSLDELLEVVWSGQ